MHLAMLMEIGEKVMKGFRNSGYRHVKTKILNKISWSRVLHIADCHICCPLVI